MDVGRKADEEVDEFKMIINKNAKGEVEKIVSGFINRGEVTEDTLFAIMNIGFQTEYGYAYPLKNGYIIGQGLTQRFLDTHKHIKKIPVKYNT